VGIAFGDLRAITWGSWATPDQRERPTVAGIRHHADGRQRSVVIVDEPQPVNQQRARGAFTVEATNLGVVSRF
jgi:hypothetical protein